MQTDNLIFFFQNFAKTASPPFQRNNISTATSTSTFFIAPLFSSTTRILLISISFGLLRLNGMLAKRYSPASIQAFYRGCLNIRVKIRERFNNLYNRPYPNSFPLEIDVQEPPEMSSGDSSLNNG